MIKRMGRQTDRAFLGTGVMFDVLLVQQQDVLADGQQYNKQELVKTVRRWPGSCVSAGHVREDTQSPALVPMVCHVHTSRRCRQRIFHARRGEYLRFTPAFEHGNLTKRLHDIDVLARVIPCVGSRVAVH
jgi:hypothetical protein